MKILNCLNAEELLNRKSFWSIKLLRRDWNIMQRGKKTEIVKGCSLIGNII